MTPISIWADIAIPTKINELLLAGKVTLAWCRGETKRLLEENRIGLPFPPSDSQALSLAIFGSSTILNFARSSSWGARRFGESNLRLKRIGSEIEQALRKAMAQYAPSWYEVRYVSDGREVRRGILSERSAYAKDGGYGKQKALIQRSYLAASSSRATRSFPAKTGKQWT